MGEGWGGEFIGVSPSLPAVAILSSELLLELWPGKNVSNLRTKARCEERSPLVLAGLARDDYVLLLVQAVVVLYKSAMAL